MSGFVSPLFYGPDGRPFAYGPSASLGLSGDLGLPVYVLDSVTLQVFTTPNPNTLLTALPASDVPAQAVRIVPTGRTVEAGALSVVLPTEILETSGEGSNPSVADRLAVSLGGHGGTNAENNVAWAGLSDGGRPIGVDPNPLTIQPARYGRTTFGQLRVAGREVLFENVQTYALDTRAWATRLVGAGTVTYSSTSGMTAITVTSASGDVAEISTHTHFPYEPGATSHCIVTLAHSDAGQAGQTREWGFGTADDGFLFRLVDTALYIVRRSSSSGTPTDIDVIAREEWVGDHIEEDLTQINQFEIDYQWLSAGLVRFWINGLLAHTLDLRGATALPATRTGQLPLRLTVENSGASAAATINYVCSVVYLDGGTPIRFVPGSHVMTASQTGIGTAYVPVIAFRVAATLGGRANRKIVLPRLARFSNESGRGAVRLTLNPASITGGTWSAVANAPWMEVNEGLTAITGGTPMTESYLPLNQDVREMDGPVAFALNGIHLRRLADNSDGDVIVFSAKADTGTIDIVSFTATFNTLG